MTMHPLVRNLYKRVIHVGRDYPTGLDHVKKLWKEAMRKTENCPSCYKNGSPLPSLSSVAPRPIDTVGDGTSGAQDSSNQPKECHEELLKAVYRGRQLVKEMVGVIQLKKYRTMRKRYGGGTTPTLQQAMDQIEASAMESTTRKK